MVRCSRVNVPILSHQYHLRYGIFVTNVCRMKDNDKTNQFWMKSFDKAFPSSTFGVCDKLRNGRMVFLTWRRFDTASHINRIRPYLLDSLSHILRR